ncbi:hypothetical protein Hesp01_38410 [Herbidospora sp. NBRC 101105]|nr:hypothetical protein Hesp01_38410 [Herbidospora sp. NBRC 101105]
MLGALAPSRDSFVSGGGPQTPAAKGLVPLALPGKASLRSSKPFPLRLRLVCHPTKSGHPIIAIDKGKSAEPPRSLLRDAHTSRQT